VLLERLLLLGTIGATAVVGTIGATVVATAVGTIGATVVGTIGATVVGATAVGTIGAIGARSYCCWNYSCYWSDCCCWNYWSYCCCLETSSKRIFKKNINPVDWRIIIIIGYTHVCRKSFR
jgi:hypothetical protein